MLGIVASARARKYARRIGEEHGQVRLAVHGDDGEPALAAVAQPQARGFVLRHVVQDVRTGERDEPYASTKNAEPRATIDAFRPPHGDELGQRLFRFGERARRARRIGGGGRRWRGDATTIAAITRADPRSPPAHSTRIISVSTRSASCSGIVEAKERGQRRRDVLGAARGRVRARLAPAGPRNTTGTCRSCS